MNREKTLKEAKNELYNYILDWGRKYEFNLQDIVGFLEILKNNLMLNCLDVEAFRELIKEKLRDEKY